MSEKQGAALDTKVITYWQPKGHKYNAVHETTLAEGIVYQTEWVDDVLDGKCVMIYDHTNDGSNNPGTLTVIVNPL